MRYSSVLLWEQSQHLRYRNLHTFHYVYAMSRPFRRLVMKIQSWRGTVSRGFEDATRA